MLAFFPRFVMVSLIQWAQGRRLPVAFVQSPYSCSVAAAIVISIQAVGVVLVVAPHYSSCRGSLITKRIIPLMLRLQPLGCFLPLQALTYPITCAPPRLL